MSAQLAEKGVSTVKLPKSFGQAFLKACEVKKRGNSLRELRDWINPISQPLSESTSALSNSLANSFSCRARNPLFLRRFFFAKLQLLAIAAEPAKPLFICACGIKEKSGINEFVQTNKLRTFGPHSSATCNISGRRLSVRFLNFL